mmetsp:Transcript_48537/g.89132  ORF Transcript_48537/g.89132 Transcript_48537/m.89132 type:complete len:129 (+) Transcript_48537:26-412(+)
MAPRPSATSMFKCSDGNKFTKLVPQNQYIWMSEGHKKQRCPQEHCCCAAVHKDTSTRAFDKSKSPPHKAIRTRLGLLLVCLDRVPIDLLQFFKTSFRAPLYNLFFWCFLLNTVSQHNILCRWNFPAAQ